MSPSDEWPEVTFGGTADPYIDRIPDEEHLLSSPKKVIVYGTVAGVGWSLVGFKVKRGARDTDDDPPLPGGPHMEFCLEGGAGGSGYAGVREGSHISMHGHLFGMDPPIAAWVGFASPDVDHVEIRRRGVSVKEIQVKPGPSGFPRYFLFFPPPDLKADVTAVDARGALLQPLALPDVEIHPGTSIGVSVNAVSWPTRQSLEAEAGRTLSNAAFPLYAVPPQSWKGDVFLSGAWGGANHPLAVRLLYVDDATVERHDRAVEIVCIGAEGLEHRSLDQGELTDEHSYPNEVINFANRFTRVPHRPVPGAERFTGPGQVVTVPSAGPRHPLDPGRIPLEGGTSVERATFSEYPALRLHRLKLPGVEVIILSWGLHDTELDTFIRGLRQMKPGKDFEEIKAAEYAAWRRIRKHRKAD